MVKPMNGLRPRSLYEWQLRSRSLPLGERTLIMAIINLTPDSFSGDGLLSSGPAAAGAKFAVALRAWKKAVFYYPDDTGLMQEAATFAAKFHETELQRQVDAGAALPTAQGQPHP